MIKSTIFAVRDIVAVQRREAERGSLAQRLLEADCRASGLSVFKKRNSLHKMDFIPQEWYRPNATGNSAATARRECDRGEWKEVKTRKGTKKQWKGKIQTVNRVTINNDLRQDRDSRNNERYVQVATKANKLQSTYDRLRCNGELDRARVVYSMLVKCLCWLSRWTEIAASESLDAKQVRHVHNTTMYYGVVPIDRQGFTETQND